MSRTTHAARVSAARKARSNGTIAQLISQHKGPNTSPTPGADYGDNKPEDVAKAFNETHDHSISQWQAGKGVVGPTGSEDWLSPLNNPHTSGYEGNQNFAYQHDLQATDAELQAKTPEQKKAYSWANKKSALEGMFVLRATGDVKKALATTQRVFKDAGFTVRQDYSQ